MTLEYEDFELSVPVYTSLTLNGVTVPGITLLPKLEQSNEDIYITVLRLKDFLNFN